MDGYRALAVKNGSVTLYSRLENSLNVKHPYVVEPLAALPDGTVVDGELVALDDDGRPNFNLMQKFREAADRIHYYVFDLLVLKGRDLTRLPLSERRKLLKTEIKIKDDRIRLMEFAEASSDQILKAVREQKLEGIIGKRADSFYEVGQRSGSVDKIQAELRAGVRDRRLHAGIARAGCADRWLLSRQGFDLLCEGAEWLRSSNASECIRSTQTAGSNEVSLRKSAGDAEKSMGRGADCGQNERMRLGKAEDGSAD